MSGEGDVRLMGSIGGVAGENGWMANISEAFSVALEYLQNGWVAEAERICNQIVSLDANYADAWHLLGVIAQQARQFDVAAERLQRCVAFNPLDAEAFNNLGIAQRELQKPSEALASFRRAVELQPTFGVAHYNLANACHELALLDEAIAGYWRAIELLPGFADAYSNVGSALRDKGRLQEAIEWYQRALQLRPGHADTCSNLGSAFHMLNQFDEAILCYRKAIELNPKLAEAHNRLGMALQGQGHLDEAMQSFGRAIDLEPHHAEAHTNLGTALKDSGQFDEAIGSFRNAISWRPAFFRAYSNLLYTIQYSPRYDAVAIFEEHCKWNAQHTAGLADSVKSHANDRTAERRLRIGYVSPCFRKHCQSLFIVPLFASHDHTGFEIFCYADDACPDAVSERIRSYADVWKNISGQTDEEVARIVRSDEIDILVDLTMHMVKSRPLLFARKPAPIQVCWLAYPGTTGLTAIDYRLTDPYLDPVDNNDGIYSEKSIRLPDTFWCYDPLISEPVVNALPAVANGYVTFGSFNNFCKVNDLVLAVWARVLKAVERSRLVLLVPETVRREHVLSVFRSEGVSAERIEFITPRLRPEYLRLYHRVDVGLDTFPYNGHTTSLDSFWMGVPVVTLAGETVVGRAGVSQLMNLELPELIARSPEEFVAIACGLAKDVRRLGEMRSTLRGRMETSPLMDGPRFARGVEGAYREMWRTWCLQVE